MQRKLLLKFQCGLLRDVGIIDVYRHMDGAPLRGAFPVVVQFKVKLMIDKYNFYQKYSGCHWKVYECCFMMQNCHFQRSVMQYKSATIPLSSSAIHTTHQNFQKRYITLFLLSWPKSHRPSKFDYLDFLSNTHFTILLWLITCVIPLINKKVICLF